MEFAVIFDMDGVIVDSNPFHKKSLQQFLRQYGRELSEDSLSGIESAARAGTKAIGVTTTHTPEELRGAVMTIRDFREVSPGVLRELMEQAVFD
jgi:beta-phosphoglucomutase-like phosphatase (HAD superfamily)